MKTGAQTMQLHQFPWGMHSHRPCRTREPVQLARARLHAQQWPGETYQICPRLEGSITFSGPMPLPYSAKASSSASLTFLAHSSSHTSCALSGSPLAANPSASFLSDCTRPTWTPAQAGLGAVLLLYGFCQH